MGMAVEDNGVARLSATIPPTQVITLSWNAAMNRHDRQMFPKLHNSAWPGVVGKGDGKGSEPAIDLETMLDFTAAAEVDGTKFDGVDLALHPPHVALDPSDDDLAALAERIMARGLVVGSVGGTGLDGDGGWARAGRRRWPDALPGAGPQGVSHCEPPPRWEPAPTASSGSTRHAAQPSGHLTLTATSAGLLRPSSKRPASPVTTVSDWLPKVKSVGAACTPGAG